MVHGSDRKPNVTLEEARTILQTTQDPEKWALANTVVSLIAACELQKAALDDADQELAVAQTLLENAQVELSDIKRGAA